MYHTSHVTAYKAHTQAALRKEVGAYKHDAIHMKQRQAQHGLADVLSANNLVKDMAEALSVGPMPEWFYVLHTHSCDGGEVDQETIELVDDEGTLIDNVVYNVRHLKRNRKVSKPDSTTATQYNVKGDKLGYLPYCEDPKVKAIAKARKYHGIDDILLNKDGSLKAAAKVKKTPAEKREARRLNAIKGRLAAQQRKAQAQA